MTTYKVIATNKSGAVCRDLAGVEFKSYTKAAQKARQYFGKGWFICIHNTEDGGIAKSFLITKES